MRKSGLFSVGMLFLLTVGTCGEMRPATAEEPIPAALANYVNRPEPVYGWKLRGVRQLPVGRILDVELTSQKWQQLTWKHALQIYEPREIKFTETVLLFVTGGSNVSRPDEGDHKQGFLMAQQAQGRVAILHQVPNQPHMGNRYEDDLISETWLRYLQTGDESWPLLFPMVKSAAKAMDAIQEIAPQQWQGNVEHFVISGASKRGWTSWLAAYADRRIVGTAPIVIDCLNFRAQTSNQLKMWGRYSEQINDYSSKGLLISGAESGRQRHLRRMMDPYTYREELTVPKLIINGTNDPYWVVDAIKFYWPELRGEKYVLQIPNAGHGLGGGVGKATATLAAFFRSQAGGRALPELNWNVATTETQINFSIQSSVKPVGARYWVAYSDDLEFRDARWESRGLNRNGDDYDLELARPAEGYVAHFAELQFEQEGLPFSLCSVVRRD